MIKTRFRLWFSLRTAWYCGFAAWHQLPLMRPGDSLTISYDIKLGKANVEGLEVSREERDLSK